MKVFKLKLLNFFSQKQLKTVKFQTQTFQAEFSKLLHSSHDFFITLILIIAQFNELEKRKYQQRVDTRIANADCKHWLKIMQIQIS